MKRQWNYPHFFPRPIIIVNFVDKNPNITYPCDIRVHYFSIVLTFEYSGLSPTQHLVFLTISKQKSWQFTKEGMSKATVQVAWISDITLSHFWGSIQQSAQSSVWNWGYSAGIWTSLLRLTLLQAIIMEPSLSYCQNTVTFMWLV